MATFASLELGLIRDGQLNSSLHVVEVGVVAMLAEAIGQARPMAPCCVED